MRVHRLLNALADLLLPRRCPVCGRNLLLDERFLCLDCNEDLPLTYFWQQKPNPMMRKYAQALASASDTGDCGAAEAPSFATALFFYKGGYQHLTQELKYHADIDFGRYLAGRLASTIAECPFLSDIDSVVAVPLHWWRRLRRGYNQADIIAEEIVSKLQSCGLGVRQEFWLERTRHTRSQTRMKGKSKSGNVAGAFAGRIKLCPGTQEAIPGHILLVDDVFTSGSTLCECQRALRRALQERFGASAAQSVKISIATLAFVGE